MTDSDTNAAVDPQSIALVLRQCVITFGGVEQTALGPRAATLIEHQARQIAGLRGGQCSCAEIAGEDPRCIKHGEGTIWAKENPDLCLLSERLSDLATALDAYRRALLPVVMTLAEREMVDDPVPSDAVLFSFMGSGASDHVTVGEFQKAEALAIEVLRARNTLSDNAA